MSNNRDDGRVARFLRAPDPSEEPRVKLRWWLLVPAEEGVQTLFGQTEEGLWRMTSPVANIDPSPVPTWLRTSSGREYDLGLPLSEASDDVRATALAALEAFGVEVIPLGETVSVKVTVEEAPQ